MIVVTGEFGMGTSVLYLVDTQQKTLLVYQAQGGSQSNLKFVAARDITYDLKVKSYNDATEAGMSVEKLERIWRQSHGRKRPGGVVPRSEARRGKLARRRASASSGSVEDRSRPSRSGGPLK